MKKLISALLILSMVFVLAACGGNNNSGSGTSGGTTEEVVGLWGYDSVDFDLDKFNEGVSDEEKVTEAELEEYKSFYAMFLSGMYFDFKDDGTGVVGYIAIEGEGTEGENDESPFKYSDGKFTFDDADDMGFGTYSVKDGLLNVVDSEDEGVTLKFKKVESLDEIKSQMNELMESLEGMMDTGEDSEG